MKRDRRGRSFSIRATAHPTRPTDERFRQARRAGGLVELPTADDGTRCLGVRYPLLIDFLRDRGRIDANDHQIALRVRELYERTSFRAHVTSAYRERSGRAAEDPEQEAMDDHYRRLDRRVLRNAGQDAWTALRAVVIEDRMTASFNSLPRALAEAERWL